MRTTSLFISSIVATPAIHELTAKKRRQCFPDVLSQKTLCIFHKKKSIEDN